MTKKNLIIIIILLVIIDLVAAAWYMVQRNESNSKSQDIFEQFEDGIAEADTTSGPSQPDEFDKMQHNTYYFTAKTPANYGDASSYYTSTKHVKVIWPKSVNGNDNPVNLTNELIKSAFGNSQSTLKDARYVYMKVPKFNKPIGDDYRTVSEAPNVFPIYGNVTQVLVYPYMTSKRILVMEIDKSEYNGATTSESCSYVNYDRQRQRVLNASDILDQSKSNKVLKAINKKIDKLNKKRDDADQLSHALNVPVELCLSKKGIIFEFQAGTLSKGRYEVLVDYDDIDDYFTDEFGKIVDENGNYSLYGEKLSPEPLHYDVAKAKASVRAERNKAAYSPKKTGGKTKKRGYKWK